MKKYRDRIRMWKDAPLGLHWDARVYNTFILPVLGYIAQLENPPEWALAEIRDSLKLVAKGPGDGPPLRICGHSKKTMASHARSSIWAPWLLRHRSVCTLSMVPANLGPSSAKIMFARRGSSGTQLNLAIFPNGAPGTMATS